MKTMGSRIVELATLIFANTEKIEEYLIANSLPLPSFDEDGPVTLQLSPELQAARSAALNATTELHALLQSPDELLRPIVCLLPLSFIAWYTMCHVYEAYFYPVEWHQPGSYITV